MPPKSNSGFVRVDDLMAQVTNIEQVARYYNVELPPMTRVASDTRCELRSRCYLNCGRSEPTSERALAIQVETAGKVWRCFAGGCGRSGNLLGLMDLFASGQHMDGKPRGERFKQLARDLAAIVDGHERADDSAGSSAKPAVERAPERNVPLAQSDNERARGLVRLDEQFLLPDRIDEMPPAVSRHFRERAHFLTPELCRQYRVGYLPQSAKSLLRGKVVYPYHNAEGELLTWFGIDPAYGDKLRRWKAGDRSDSEPIHTHFVKGFHYGQELWGEHVVRMLAPRGRESLHVLTSPSDCLRLQAAGVPAVALCAAAITAEQVERVAGLAEQIQSPVVRFMFSADEVGDEALKQVLPMLAERLPVQLAWSRRNVASELRGRSVDSLSDDELQSLLERPAGDV